MKKMLNIQIIFLISKSEVIKKELTKVAINIKEDNITSNVKIPEKLFSLLLSLDNSLVETSITPKSEKMDIMETKENAKANLPYSVAPKILTTYTIKTNANILITISDKTNQKVFFTMVWRIPILLKSKFLKFLNI